MATTFLCSISPLMRQRGCRSVLSRGDLRRFPAMRDLVRKHNLFHMHRETLFQTLDTLKKLRSKMCTRASPGDDPSPNSEEGEEQEGEEQEGEDPLMLRSTEEDVDTVTDLMDLFKIADKDGYGEHF
jgi:hypothetical protein